MLLSGQHGLELLRSSEALARSSSQGVTLVFELFCIDRAVGTKLVHTVFPASVSVNETYCKVKDPD